MKNGAGDLYSEGRFNRGFFALRFWGTYFRNFTVYRLSAKKTDRCREVAVVEGWPLVEVRLYTFRPLEKWLHEIKTPFTFCFLHSPLLTLRPKVAILGLVGEAKVLNKIPRYMKYTSLVPVFAADCLYCFRSRLSKTPLAFRPRAYYYFTHRNRMFTGKQSLKEIARISSYKAKKFNLKQLFYVLVLCLICGIFIFFLLNLL